MLLDRLIDEVFCEAVDPLTQLVLLEQMLELQDRFSIRNPFADQFDLCKVAQRTVATSISSSSMAGSLSVCHYCITLIRSIVAMDKADGHLCC